MEPRNVLTNPPGDFDLRTVGLVHESREQSRLLGQKQSRHKEYTFLEYTFMSMS